VSSIDELVEQLEVLPEFVVACGFRNAKAPGYEADDFFAAVVAAEKRRHRTVLVASGDRIVSSSRPIPRPSYTR
jgi:5'-3' exonuclease